MSKTKEYIMSIEESAPPEFYDGSEYYRAMEEMSYHRIVDDLVNIMLMYGHATVMRDVDAKYTVANKQIWGKH